VSRVVCAGHLNWDVTLRVDRLPEPDGEAAIRSETGERGGSAANVACTLSDLAVETSLLASVGGDDHGAAATAACADAGVATDHVVRVPDAATAVKYLIVAPCGAVMVVGRAGANEAYAAADLPASALEAAAHLHLTGQDPATAATLADRARAAGLTVSFDPGRRVGDRAYAETISRSDLLFLNDREADLALGADAPGGRTLVLKHGSSGAEAYASDGHHAHPGFDVSVVDTSGAGDAFAAGFLAAYLDDAGTGRCLAVANACGALAAATPGRRAPIDWDAVGGLVDDA
jgi:ribokinase